FLGARRPPGRLNASYGVLNSAKRLTPALSANLLIACLRMGRAAGVGCRQADHKQTAFGELRRFSQRLSESEMRLEAAGGRVGAAVELAGVRPPLVDQNETGAVIVHQPAQHVAGARGLLVIRTDALKRLLGFLGSAYRMAELPGQLAPQRAHHRAVGFYR